MRTSTVSILYKATFFISALFLLTVRVSAQTDISIGTGTTGNGSTGYPCPLQDYYEGSRAQYLFKASELTAAGMGPGMISAIKFNVINVNGAEINEDVTIKIGTTAVSTLGSSSWETPGPTVFGPANYQTVTGINTFTFTSPFFWNGSDNLLVEVCNGGDDYTQNPTIPWTAGLAFNASHTYRADNQGSLCGTTNTLNTGDQTTRPNLTFRWQPAASCTGVPTGGTAVANPGTVCLNGSVTLNLTGASVATGLTYQWQSSSNNTSWTNITGATNPNYTTTQAATTYYRCKLTCTNTGGGTAFSSGVQVTTPNAVSGTFNINKANPTGGTNFNSFNDAYNYIKCGISGNVVFNVTAGSGPYNEQLIMTAVPGASATKTVTFNGNGESLAYLSTNGSERAVIKLDGADHITFNNLAIEAKGTTSSNYGFGVQLLNDADSNKISNCIIKVDSASNSNQYAGIVVSASATSATGTGAAKCDGNTFSGNTIIGGYYGLTLVGSNTDANGNNKIIGNTFKDFYNYGLYLTGSFNTLIDSNTISRPSRTSVAECYGIYLTSLNTRDYISRNRITNPFGGVPTSTSTFYGIYFSSVDAIPSLENVVSNNLIYKLSGSGTVYGIYNSSSDNVWYYHNTIVLDGPAASSSPSYQTRGFYQTSQGDGINFNNNIIAISRGGQSTKHAMYFNNATSTIVSNRNVFFTAPTAPNGMVGYAAGANQATLANWQQASGQDTNSLTTNPLFTDVSTDNYKPLNASINNRGEYVNIATDITGATRSTTTPDIGAYEFTPGPCTSPPTPGTAIVASATVCVNVNVPFGLTGNSVGLSQTFQWQRATTETGPYTNLGSSLTNPDTLIKAVTTAYYRVAVTCNGMTEYSEPVLLTVTQALPGDVYTINKNAPAGGKNFTSFAAAKSALECGIAGEVTFNVVAGSGPYNEQLVLDSIPGASSVNTVTFNGNGNTIKFSSSSTDERAVIKLRRSDYVTIDSLTIDATGTGSYGYGVQLINNADSNIIRNCKILTSLTATSDDYGGIVVNAEDDGITDNGNTWCDNNTFDHNVITGGYYTISIAGSDDDPIKGNKVTNNTVQDFYSDGIHIDGVANTLIEGNVISRPTREDGSWSVSAIYISGKNDKITLSKNRVTNLFGGDPAGTTTGYGIYFSSSDAVTKNDVINNIFYNLKGDGTQYAIYNYSSDNINFYHNTISLDDVTSTSSSAAYGIYLSSAGGIQVINNIITVTRGGTGSRYAIYASSVNDLIADHNDYYVQGGGTQNYTGYFNGNQNTLDNWKTASGQDSSSISMDPVYGDLATGNLAPVVSPLDNTGTPAGVATDILGKTRSTTKPDMGAFEIAIPPCTAPPVAGTSVAVPDSNICMGIPIKLKLSGNSSGGTQTYQWQSATSATGAWINISEVRYVPDFTTELTTRNYFRCRVVCGGDTAYSTPVHVLMNPPLVSGDYTIDPAGTGNRNYTSFASAVAALECGIAGWVTFHVAPGTYTEQVRIRRIPGATDTSRVTFLSANRNAASVTLTFNSTSTGSNYVLKLDSSSHITYKYITIKATNSNNGRAVELAGTSSYDSLLNSHIIAPATTNTGDGMAAIYGDNYRGKYTVIKGNTITNGSRGISLEAPSATERLTGLVIDSNTVNGAYYYSIYVYYSNRLKVNKNTVNIKAPLSSTANGIYLYYADTAYEVIRNKVRISNATSTVNGIYIYYSEGTQAMPSLVTGNRVTALTGNTGSLNGLRIYQSSNSMVANNIVSIKTSGSSSYGLYSEGVENVNYYNNSVLSAATSTSDNAAAYFGGYGNNNVKVRNNIFANKGGGRALQVSNLNNLNSDYNTLYTSGSTLVQLDGFPDVDYATIHPWRDTANLDLASIVYKPAFADDSTLMPDVADPQVWAIHGRGVQAPDNDRDINDKPRPVTLTAGVPDMGAYEFLPTVLPPVLPATPARPAPGITQRFMFGTDTVAKISWGPAAPDSVSIRRYSGVVPPGLDTSMKYMYFYTDVQVHGNTAYNYSLQQYYVDSWQGFIKQQKDIRLGRTQTDSTWKINDSSKVNQIWNVISDTSLQFLDKFTGLQGQSVNPPPRIQPADSSNRGTRFWAAYGAHQLFDGNSQNMVIYLSAEDSANVTVRINGTSWEKQYHIPANSVITSDIIPKTGLNDARLTSEGWFDKGISIESDTPIVAYAHQYGSASSGATMLLPVGTYGYEYYTLAFKQYYTIETSYSNFYVIADQDNTVVEITPAAATLAGKPADVPFRVTLNSGEVYQVLGAKTDTYNGYDLSGSRVRSVPNSDGKCLPMTVFTGSSRVAISCANGNSSSGDIMFQQIFPSQAWGTKYLTAPTSIDNTPSSLMTNIYRVLVKDTATVVKRNNVVLTGLINKRYYQYESNTADYIESDKPVLVAQYMSSTGGCDNTGGDGDPEMIFISPIEQGIKKVGLYRNTEEDINVNYLTLIIPTGGVSSLTIDSSSTFDHTYLHPNKPGYTVVIKRFDAEQAQCIAESDSAFTAITYGLGSVESYGYNAGTLVKNLNFRPSFTNIYSGSENASTYTCAKTPFKFSILLNGLPTSLTWQFSKVPGLSPGTDLVQTAPKPVDSVMINDRQYYKYMVDADYKFAEAGTYYVPITIKHPDIESCENSLETILPVNVIAAPVVDFDVSYSGCVNDVAQFTGSAVTANGAAIDKWKWEFSDSTTAASKDTSRQFKQGGTYNVRLSIVEAAGCIGDTTKQVVVNEPVTAQLVKDTLAVCIGTDVTFTVKDPLPNTVYSWYTTPTGGTPIDTGTSYTIGNITTPGAYYVGTETAGCKGVGRARGVVFVLPLPTVPEVTVDSVGVHAVKYKWKAIPEATAYEVSTDGGVTWKTPSSGEHGLTHTITGLQPVQDVTLMVKAKGCEDKISPAVPAKTLPDGIFIPNAFSPNGDGLNDVLKVYGYIISEMHMIIFNQWGEKVFESNSQATGWDGMYKGKAQPSGVYIYVCKLKLMDGTSAEKKGAINLIR